MKKVFAILGVLVWNVVTAQFMSTDPVARSFCPQPGEKYVISAWVLEDHPQSAVPFTYEDTHIDIIWSETETLTFYPQGAIIDGWQRITGVFAIPNEAAVFEMKLRSDDPAIDSYFDDVRIYPFNGNMKSFVYDSVTQRLMAELDENNYATFYEYDEEGGLIRVKKETERGVQTIQETRSKTSKGI